MGTGDTYCTDLPFFPMREPNSCLDSWTAFSIFPRFERHHAHQHCSPMGRVITTSYLLFTPTLTPMFRGAVPGRC